jgi:hypothetical protein
MAKKSGYNTNLASEFFVLSCLHRVGIDACLTLGNKKAVDIVAWRLSGELVAIEVKAVAGKHDWFTGSAETYDKDRMYVALVSFSGRIDDTREMPQVWVLPGRIAASLVKKYKGAFGITRKSVRDRCSRFEHGWGVLLRDKGWPELGPA